MSDAGPLTPVRRDILLALVALGLLAGPLWAPALNLAGPTYEYERAEVTTDDTGIEYANESAVPVGSRPPISDDIACSETREIRACAFERLLLENRTVPTEVHTTDPDAFRFRGEVAERYQYVLVDDAVYEPAYTPNRSVRTDDGLFRVDLDLEEADPDEALERVSLRAGSDDLPSTVADAARTGEATARRDVAVPATPIRLEDGTYYRVYQSDRSTRPPLWRGIDRFFRYLAPFVGLSLFARLSGRISYVGPETDAEKTNRSRTKRRS